jgi:hypothetical protein
MFIVSLPMLVVVLNCCVTETSDTSCFSSSSTSFVKSMRDRERRSILYTTMVSTRPARTCRMSSWRAGRSRVAPE